MNWLHNGQGNGGHGDRGLHAQRSTTSDAALMAITRNADAKYWIPTENEWYKAAYHKNDGVTGNYWDYPTSSDSVPSNDLIDPDPGNNANFYQDGYTIGSPYYTTEVGEFENSASPYGTFDQGGNVWEWNETAVTEFVAWCAGRLLGQHSGDMLASSRHGYTPDVRDLDIGFRVASVPEPASICLFSFYNNSSWDDGDGSANAADDAQSPRTRSRCCPV